MSRGGDFWSRRKARVREEERAEALALETRERAVRDAELDGKSDAAILEELGLPDPDTLSPGDNVRAFMQDAVPERLRRRALRRLWQGNPALANLDGLVDYGEDFTDGATVIENLQTAYRVGKGMFARIEEMEVAREAEIREAAAAADDPGTIAMTPADAVDENEVPPEEAAAASAEAADDGMPEAAPPRRRMRFTFEDRAGGSA